MAVYIVTGKLGGGKTLGAVSKIDEALGQGRRVATNLDLRLDKLPSVGRRAKRCRVVRVPDRPSASDIESIGFGIEGVGSLAEARKNYDEDKFGLLVLDECGTWLNSREWQDEGRRELINLLLHIRKHLWDVYLIIQDISMLDKQARKALAENVVYCRRFDRIGVPLISFVSEHLFGKRLSMPRMHMGIVKYGDQPNSLTVNRWWYNGSALFDAYDTTQVFMGDYQTGIYSLLPPFYYHSKSLVKWNLRKVMQLTKIYLRQHSRTILLAAGVFAGGMGASAFSPDQQSPVAALPHLDDAEPLVEIGAPPGVSIAETRFIDMLKFGSLINEGAGESVTFDNNGDRVEIVELESFGITVRKTAYCRWRLDDTKHSITRIITCFD